MDENKSIIFRGRHWEFQASSEAECHHTKQKCAVNLQFCYLLSYCEKPAYTLIYLAISRECGRLLENGQKVWCRPMSYLKMQKARKCLRVWPLSFTEVTKCFRVWLLFFTGVTKQLFPSADDVSIRRMIGQKLNNCTKKPNLSKSLSAQDVK
jgi:hypothetical protein